MNYLNGENKDCLLNDLRTFLTNDDEVIEEEKLNSLKLNISHGCNLACTYCYTGQGIGKGIHGDFGVMMPLNMAKRISLLIDKYIPKIKRLTFFGGEPTLNIPVIRYFCEKYPNISFLMQTNGTTLRNPRLLELIKKYNFRITVSIDGPKEIHDKYRRTLKGKPSYDVVKQNVHFINEYYPGKIVSIQATYSPFAQKLYSRKEFAETIYKEFKVKRISAKYMMDVETGTTVGHDFDYNPAKDFHDEILTSRKYRYNSRMTDIVESFLFGGKSKYFCDGAVSFESVDPHGDIWPCDLLIKTDRKIANVFDSPEKVWESMINYKKAFFGDFDKTNLPCRNCIANFFCRKCQARKELSDFRDCSKKRLDVKTAFDLLADNIDKIDFINKNVGSKAISY